VRFFIYLCQKKKEIMPTVPSGPKFIGISSNVDTLERKSSLANSPSQIYTIDDIVSSVPAQESVSGIHALIKPISGMLITPAVAGGGQTTVNYPAADTIVAYPFIPNNTFSVTELNVEVTTAASGNNIRVMIYSHGESTALPDQKLFESDNVSTTSTGVKVIPCSFEFVAGETYWFASHGGSLGIGMRALDSPQLFSIGINPADGNIINIILKTGVPVGSAPQTFGTSVSPSFGKAWRVILKAE